MKYIKALILDLQMPSNKTNLKIYPLTLFPSKKVSRIPKITSLGHRPSKRILTEMQITPSALGDFILHRVSDFGYYNHVITMIDCYVILNSFGEYYLDFQLVNENVSDVFTQ